MSTATERTVERSVLIHRPGSAQDETPETQPVTDPEDAAELVECLADEGVKAQAVVRNVTQWEPDEQAQQARKRLQRAHVVDTVREYMKDHRDADEVGELLRRFTPDMSDLVRGYWIRDLGNLLAVRDRFTDEPDWLTTRIDQAVKVLAGHLPVAYLAT
ncbi:hypothetical protein ACQPZ8_01760 [Actinomadura nitritigenes]|uniref:hypothetical protein n=1 Tax=Actinomadura nitritigenes TaxID=134602 RepID=UPI003D94C4D5